MARIHDLIRQIETSDPALAKELSKEVSVLSDRRAFGLNFERHTPEQVELPGRPVRVGDKVHVLPPRGESAKKENKRIWLVDSINRSIDEPIAKLRAQNSPDDQTEIAIADLVVVAEFRDPIYPGLVSTGRVERGGNKPFHTVINGENFHALEALLFTHRGKVDAIYIDPPYNTGAKDWKYNNDYVESEDLYRHSKWLAFMERRLFLAHQLLDPNAGVMVVTIDENEQARLQILLEQVFLGFSVVSVPIVHNPRGVQGQNFSHTHETAIFVFPSGKKSISERRLSDVEIASNASNLRNWGGDSLRTDAKNCFYPIIIRDGIILSFGDVPNDDHHPSANVSLPDGSTEIWPIDENGVERKWRYARQSVEQIRDSLFVKQARNGDLGVQLAKTTGRFKTVWQDAKYDASVYGTQLVAQLTGRRFPFPKSLYAVEDALTAAVGNKSNATVLDFFSGSGTTAHAVMLLNKKDGGTRSSISITNNEVSADEQNELVKQGFRPGDEEWEKWGICDYITKPRIKAAVTGLTPEAEPIKGDYKFTEEFPMADGFNENVEFFTLTYESPLQIASNRSFSQVSPLLWLRAGSTGKPIEDVPESGWEVTEKYGVLFDLDATEVFVEQINAVLSVTHAFVFTEEDRLFEVVAQKLPAHIEVVRMYEAYMRNAEIEAPGVAR